MDYRLALVGLLLLPSCVDAKTVGDSPLDTDGSTTAGPSESGSAEVSGSDTGEPDFCPPHPSYACGIPVQCEQGECGDVSDEFDANGCPRLRCAPESGSECPDGSTCIALGPLGSCAPSSWGCEQEGDDCACGGTADCSFFVSHCVEDEIITPEACAGIQDEETCLSMGCSAWVDSATPALTEPESNCVCGTVGNSCLWFPDGLPSSTNEPVVYVSTFTGEPILFFETWETPPYGYERCEDLAEAPETCACNGADPVCF